ncbi:MAG: alpha-ketoacid dehydrogenase subunit beta [Thermoleophilia bacterium]
MTELKYYQAVQQALAEELARDPRSLLMGEDVGRPGGIFAQSRGLYNEFGPNRVIDTPAGELGFVGAAVGMAMTGLRPIVEISFADFFATCFDQVVNQAAKLRFMSGGQAAIPITFTSFGGGGLNAGPQHSSTYEAILGGIPGLRVVTAATPADAKGLLKTAIREDDPVVVLFHKGLLQERGDVPDGEHLTPIGVAEVCRAGHDLTIATWAGGRRRSLAAAEQLAADGIEAEVIDLRSIQPLDAATVADSVRRTRRLLIVQETVGFSGIGGELALQVGELAFDYLDAPIGRLSAPFAPTAFSPPLEQAYLPAPERIVETARELLA